MIRRRGPPAPERWCGPGRNALMLILSARLPEGHSFSSRSSNAIRRMGDCSGATFVPVIYHGFFRAKGERRSIDSPSLRTRPGLPMPISGSLSRSRWPTMWNISGLRGRGGAAYSVWKKWDVARRIDADCKYVVANADEGDAGTYCDRMMMEGEPFRLIEGMAICAQAIGADQGYIYCRQEYPIAQKVLQQAITIAEQAGMLDLEGRRFHIEVFGGAGAYVCGEETALLESLEGRRGVVRPKPPYPAAVGLYGRPTVVSNVLTFATVPSILACGGSWYASMGTEQSSGTIALQIGGRVKQPGLVEIPFGATLEEVLDRFGGGMAPGARFKAVQVGGPLGSLFPVEKLDIRICYDEFTKADAILGHGGIVVFDDETDMVEMARHFMAFTA